MRFKKISIAVFATMLLFLLGTAVLNSQGAKEINKLPAPGSPPPGLVLK